MPEKSATTFLILAWAIISWPFRMPPSSSPMMTSTIAISTRVKPDCLVFISHPLNRFSLLLYSQTACQCNGCKNSYLRQAKVKKTSGFGQTVDGSTLGRRGQPGLQFLQPALEKPALLGIANAPGGEQAAQHHLGRFELVHVF